MLYDGADGATVENYSGRDRSGATMQQMPQDESDPSDGYGYVIPGELVDTGYAGSDERSYDPWGGSGQTPYPAAHPSPYGDPQHSQYPAAQQGPYTASASHPGQGRQTPTTAVQPYSAGYATAQPVQPVYPQPLPPLPEKSVGLALLLTFLFGPLGLLYSSVTGAIILLVIGFVIGLGIGVIGLLTAGLGLFLVPLVGFPIWLTSVIWGPVATSSHNERVQAEYAQYAAAYAQYGAAYGSYAAQHAQGHGSPRY